MAAFNFHRKLIEETPPNTTTICSTKCNPCIPICFPICPHLCNSTTTQPPPPPPPTTVDIILKISPPKHHHSSLSLPLKISLVILVLTFSLFLLYTLYKFYTVWYRRRRPPPQSPPPENQETLDEFVDHDVLDHPIWYIRTIGLNPSVISAITVVKFSKNNGLIEGTDCSVCLSDFEEDETLRLLPKCNHAFHVSCIDTWLRSHTNCPLCRAGIVRAGSDPNPGGSGRIEEARLAISVPDVEEREREDEGSELDEDPHVNVNDDGGNKGGEVVGGGGGGSGGDLLIIRRSISLNDYGDCRIRSSDVHNNNNYYSDRHQFQVQVQVQPLEESEEIHPQFHDS
ncbi:hypothetical protein OSB04_030805 [Centaurea solstitialis]|uniref:RING-type E3 ubiquitin transferase n=1 Tax=Centaurea solstitialis TaxID=347529 RepID=A0AA38VTP1_9ASTR|nr:hypothetical protein OSB04_030805 [Centaurea solstitialis]